MVAPLNEEFAATKDDVGIAMIKLLIRQRWCLSPSTKVELTRDDKTTEWICIPEAWNLLNTGHAKLISLPLDCNKIDDQGAQKLAACLKKKNGALKRLILDGNLIGDEGACALAAAIKKGRCALKALDLDGNQVGDDGAKALAEALSSPKVALEQLYLGNNCIGDDGAVAFAKALQTGKCDHLKNLELCGNRVGDHGAQVLAQVAS